MVDTGDLKSPGLAAVRVRAPFRVSFESEFDTIRFWLFYFLLHKELQALPCNVKEHIGPNNKAFLAYLCNEKEQVVRFLLLSFTRL